MSNKKKLLNSIRDAMLEYQMLHSVEKCCITNTQIMYDILNSNYFKSLNLKPIIKAVYVIYKDNYTDIHLTGGHLIIVLNGDITYDCSYDISSKNDILYYDNYKDFKEELSNYSQNYLIKTCLKQNIDFTNNFANKMNNGEFIITSRESYHNQLNYIENKLGFKFLMN